ncbi:CmlA1 leader peptide [Escherichia coli]|uniref:CmlA1 leader peptide n=2 Tax=Gammaproteobacteria TaxID=1236 RepID=A0A0K2B799_ECOLX|nr:leader peptide - Pseudomonas sp. plasmid R1033 transposon Tn1696 [Pseudomonas sp.]AAB60003.1 cmlA1 leader peptide [Pseudomonas aeruginosa]AKZ61011.1 CmlA1 leader peptide [Escherichia coli]WHV03024.1 CmlA1 leader peptide [Salmonella enterica subsp. enterica serovar Typhimurium var. monophasic 4,[5],12:i:-]AAK50390.1 CmlA1 leader peptide [Pseudomonas aeruginosa]AOG75630.1 CmlA1 leader peptide [Escherichia coli]
MSTSKNADK